MSRGGGGGGGGVSGVTRLPCPSHIKAADLAGFRKINCCYIKMSAVHLPKKYKLVN